jgi:tetratricopeptide (TPR) repeat protein
MREGRWTLIAEAYALLVRELPTAEPGARLTLGEAYYNIGVLKNEYKTLELAIAELQSDFREQNSIVRAGLLLGKCYLARGWHELARRHLTNLLDKIGTDRKAQSNVLEALYDIAGACRAMGDQEGEYEALLSVVHRDVSYRDAAERFDRLNKNIGSGA